MDDVEDIYYLNKIIIVQRLEDAKICGGPWIVGGVMRHEHHRDQSCWLTGQIYISQRKH